MDYSHDTDYLKPIMMTDIKAPYMYLLERICTGIYG